MGHGSAHSQRKVTFHLLNVLTNKNIKRKALYLAHPSSTMRL